MSSARYFHEHQPINHDVARALAAETAYPRSAVDWSDHAYAVADIVVAPRPKTRLVIIEERPVDMSWRNGTEACRDSSPALFYPSEDNEGSVVADAKAICATCPVMVACRQHGMDHETHGIWGGTTPGERWKARRGIVPNPIKERRAAKQRKPINHGTDAGYRQHLRRNEEACPECAAAHKTNNLKYPRKASA